MRQTRLCRAADPLFQEIRSTELAILPSSPEKSGRSIIASSSPAIQKRFSWVNIARSPSVATS